ncbi:MAG: hypothetical protein JRN37_07360 [Nitrososphaerota archaeon]|jgi:hypothetical protein|nr:hypothetical protein [Nitrososphaerota archaeon]
MQDKRLQGIAVMLNYDLVSRRPNIFKSFTGLELSAFGSVYEKVKAKYEEYER